jgi:polysaccharide pyruvyl transferase WcaK-like protein
VSSSLILPQAERDTSSPSIEQKRLISSDSMQSTTHLEIRVCESSVSLLPSVHSIIDAFPAIATVTAVPNRSTDGVDLRALMDVHRRCMQRGVSFSVDFTLDEGANACAALGRQPTSLTPILETSRTLRISGVPIRWWIPADPTLVYRLEALFSLARDERIEPILAPPAFSTSGSDFRPLDLDQDARRFVLDFLKYRLLEEERDLIGEGQRRYYQALNDWWTGDDSSFRAAQRTIAVVEADEQKARWTSREEQRPALTALIESNDSIATGVPTLNQKSVVGASAADVAGVLLEGVRAGGEWAKTQLLRKGSPPQKATTMMPRVLIIGAYGGEHIGDAAILGGVLLRIHRRYGTTRAIVMSQRPDHTRHLVPMLETPVDVSVAEYEQATVAELLQQVDGVVFAGGPLMDLPKQLVRHLFTVSLARRQDKPFVLEGIGAGPFLRRPSAWTARRVVRMAERISVRTSDDGRAPLVRGSRVEVGRDPAFDYLETRGAELTRLPPVDQEWLDRLLEDTEGRVTVGLNLRPNRPPFTVGVAAHKRAEYTSLVETRFEERLAETLRRFHKASPRAPRFIFFPMNAIQFGLSDLRSAYRLKRLLRGDVDLRIWEGDASIDGVVALLRRLDVAITMRFHATIYALAQKRPVIGIDYRIGIRDKVAALLGDFGQDENCARVDEMTSEWLFGRLAALSGLTIPPAGLSDERHRDNSGKNRLLPVLPRAPR